MRRVLASAAAAALVMSAGDGRAQTSGPVATYWMTAETTTGFGGGARPNPLAMMSGDLGADRRDLLLELQSTAPAPDAPRAAHATPPGISARPLPLTYDGRRLTGGSDDPGGPPPEGRMLVYWGCGDGPGATRPIAIDLTRDGAARMAELNPNVAFVAPGKPSPGPGRTYGSWPNAGAREVPAGASLAGAHEITGNYTPDIRFNLSADQDFMTPLRITGLGAPAGAQVPLAWNAVPGAKGYLALTLGEAANGDMVLWSSSATAIMAMMIPDHPTSSDLDRLLDRRIVMQPTATQCAIPAAVTAAAPDSRLRVIAFGGEANFSHPPRPADRNAPWHLEHVVKVRYVSSASAILSMPDLGAEAGEDDAGATPGPPTDAAARAVGNALGSLFGRGRR